MRIDKTCEACAGTGQVLHGKEGLVTCYSCEGVGTSYEGEVHNGSATLDERLADIKVKIDDTKEKADEIKAIVDEL